MTEASRREILAAAAALALSAGTGATAAPADAAPPETWNLTELYPTPQAWTAERAAVQAALPTLASYKDRLGTDAATLRAALQAVSDIQRRTARLNVYASIIADSDTSVAQAQERRQLAIALFGQVNEATSYLQPEILAVGAARIAAFQSADPGLGKFHFQLADILRKAPHTLGAEAENVLAAVGTPLAGAQQIRTQLVDSDLPWPEVTLSTGKVRLDQAAYTAAREAPNREDRKLVFDTFFTAFDRYKTSLAAALSTQVQSDVFTAKARRYGSAVEAALDSAGGVPAGVYRTLVEETNRGLPALHRYFEIRRKLLNLPDLHYYDIYPPLVRLDETFDLARTRSLTLAAVAPLGPEYVDLLARSTASPWADYKPRKNKVSGAYMTGDAYDVHPYLLLNLTGNYESVSTFAHEWGHAMHTLLANRAQPYETASYSIFTAEIASTMNEQLLADYMFAKARTRQEKLYYLGQLLELMRATFYRQAMFAEFELLIHETVEKGEALSGEGMNAMYLALLKKYHGPKVVIDEVVASEWAYVPHFYYDFYVYQYATSLAASAYFYDQVKTGGNKARDNYLAVLRAGGSDYPVAVLKKAGLDMTSPAPYQALVARFSRTLDQVEALI
ncbi:MAG: pepF [Caulobacteraceae bacterium]|nr:pepF [Caulobacteraceae bacterium]